MIETKRVVRIVTDLEGITEDLLNLFEDIKRDIDAHDRASRAEGTQLLLAYNAKLDTFQAASTELQNLIARITNVDVDREAEAHATAPGRPAGNERTIRTLDPQQPHGLTEDFTSMRPYGFTLGGRTFRETRSWRRLYQLVCQQFAARDQQRFQELPTAEPFRENQGSRFGRTAADFRAPLKLSYGLYAEGNVGANVIRNNVRNVLRFFGISEDELVIYLREDHVAD